ncbi:MAG: hypothetical protein COT18_09205 [Elusimicrobia bacterium CG08_land_8_20_14_0_20_59_10]|nr:MAG: hypothetical protein COT18_09205 [Elusimicrobia bacterium CG08_land_8_20_14_0_20_59_10]
MIYHALLFVLAVLTAAWAVMARSLLTSAIMLALVSVFASLLLFNFNAPWAAVFELSVCAGLITVLFIGGVSLIRASLEAAGENRLFLRLLPLALAIFAIAAWFYLPPFFTEMTGWRYIAEDTGPIGTVLWQLRRPDLLGQIAMLAAGVFVIKSVFPKRRAAK